MLQTVEKLYTDCNIAPSPARNVKTLTLRDAERIVEDMNEKIQNYQQSLIDSDDEAEDEGGPNIQNITFPVQV